MRGLDRLNIAPTVNPLSLLFLYEMPFKYRLKIKLATFFVAYNSCRMWQKMVVIAERRSGAKRSRFRQRDGRVRTWPEDPGRDICESHEE